MFYRWLTATRKSRHRRLLLQQREDELKLATVAGVWDKWRERYLDIRLQPMVCFYFRLVTTISGLMYIFQADVFLVQSQKNVVFRAFGIWHSKTKVGNLVRTERKPANKFMGI
jgi:protein SFI1